MTGLGINAAHKKNKPRGLLAAVVLLAAAAGGYWYFGREVEVEDEPLLAQVRMGSIENTISASGNLKPSNFVDVGAQVSGILQILHVEVGDVVEQGQLLAEIDARVQAERVNASRASLDSQKAQIDARASALELARLNARRQEGLRAENATSQLEYDTAMNNLANAEANLIQLQKQIEQSEAGLKNEETQLDFTKIYAPVSGTVTAILLNEGRTLNAVQMAPTILTIADLDTMTVQTQISEADVGKVKAGMPVYFTTLGNGNRRWYSTVRQILPTPTILNNVVLYTGLFDIENPDGILLPEMTTQVYFVSSSAENVLVVPMGALTFIDEPVPGAAPGAAGVAAAPAGAGAAGAGGPPGGPGGFAGGPGGPGGGQAPTPEMIERFRQMRESGGFPGGGAGGPGAGGPGGPGFGSARLTQPGQRSMAKVTVMHEDGTREERQVVIGLTSRVNAEVVSGLQAGEQVVAGIVQSDAPAAPAGNNNQNFRPQQFMRF
jgi:macrolide-specific efflux system membrane fusion protein